MPLTSAQLHYFLEHVLKISYKDAKVMKSTEPSKLLDLLSRKMHEQCPFNNIWDSLISMTLGKHRYRKAPHQLYISPYRLPMLLGQGGICLTLSYMLIALLEHLGFSDCYMGMGMIRTKPGMEMLHFIAFIPNVDFEGDLWLIDPGTLLAPIFHAVPLHKVKQLGSVYMPRSSFVVNKFTYSPEQNSYFRFYKLMDEGAEFNVFYDFTEENYTMECEELPDVMDYSRVARNRLLFEYIELKKKKSDKDLVAFWEKNLLLTGYVEGKAVRFVNKKLYLEDDNGVLQESVLDSKSEILKNLFNYFPVLNCPETVLYIDTWWTAKYGSAL